MTEKFIESLKVLAKRKVWEDKLTGDNPCMIDDFAGGNVDDAFFGGFNSGETVLAREVLDELGITYKQ